MNKEEITAKVTKVIVEHFGVDESKVTPEARLDDDMRADSLDVIELAMGMEEEFGVHIHDEQMPKLETVGGWIDYIAERAS